MPDDDAAGRDRRAEVADELVQQLHHLVLIYCHLVPLERWLVDREVRRRRCRVVAAATGAARSPNRTRSSQPTRRAASMSGIEDGPRAIRRPVLPPRASDGQVDISAGQPGAAGGRGDRAQQGVGLVQDVGRAGGLGERAETAGEVGLRAGHLDGGPDALQQDVAASSARPSASSVPACRRGRGRQPPRVPKFAAGRHGIGADHQRGVEVAREPVHPGQVRPGRTARTRVAAAIGTSASAASMRASGIGVTTGSQRDERGLEHRPLQEPEVAVTAVHRFELVTRPRARRSTSPR